MELSFDKRSVVNILATAQEGKLFFNPGYDSGKRSLSNTQPCVMLCVDVGVYLMTNIVTDGRPFVVYAKECDPTTLSFDTWRPVRDAIGDPTLIIIPLKVVEKWVNGNEGNNLRLVLNNGRVVCR